MVMKLDLQTIVSEFNSQWVLNISGLKLILVNNFHKINELSMKENVFKWCKTFFLPPDFLCKYISILFLYFLWSQEDYQY